MRESYLAMTGIRESFGRFAHISGGKFIRRADFYESSLGLV